MSKAKLSREQIKKRNIGLISQASEEISEVIQNLEPLNDKKFIQDKLAVVEDLIVRLAKANGYKVSDSKQAPPSDEPIEELLAKVMGFLATALANNSVEMIRFPFPPLAYQETIYALGNARQYFETKAFVVAL